MIFFSVSMYCEAYPIIKSLNLKKDLNFTKFQVFRNNDVILIITNSGNINSAVSVAYLLSQSKISNFDLFINLGICGTNNENFEIGTAFLCNKIIEHETQKCFYPDMLYISPFKEKSIETFPYVLKNNNFKLNADLVDMESSSVYQSAKIFLNSNQMFFIKIISDYLNVNNLNSKQIEILVEKNTNKIIEWIFNIRDNICIEDICLNIEEKDILSHISEYLKLSFSMKNQLKQMLLYYKLQNGDFSNLINDFIIKNKNIEGKSKIERKKYFDELKRKLI